MKSGFLVGGSPKKLLQQKETPLSVFKGELV